MGIIYVIVFIAFVDNFSMLPTIGPFAQHLGGDAVAMGVAVAAFSVSNLIFNVLGGILLDRSGRRRLLLLGLLSASVAMALYAVAYDVKSLVLVRLLHGAAGGILVPAIFTMLADVAPVEGRGQAMGRAGALIGSAAIVAPGVAGLVRQMAGFNAVFFLGAGMLALGFIIAALWSRETARVSASRQVAQRVWRVSQLALPGAAGALWAGIAGIFILMFAMGTLTAFLPDLVESLGYRAGMSGLMFTAFGLVAALVMMSPLSRLVDRQEMLAPATVGLALVAASSALLTVAGSLAFIMTASILFGAGYGLIFPATSGQVAAASRPESRGRAYGIFYAVFSLGVVAGAPLVGLVVSLLPAVSSPFIPAFVMSIAGIASIFALTRTVTAPAGEGKAPNLL